MKFKLVVHPKKNRDCLKRQLSSLTFEPNSPGQGISFCKCNLVPSPLFLSTFTH